MATTLLSIASTTRQAGPFTSSNFTLPANPFDIIRITFTPSGTVAANFTMTAGFFRQDGASFFPIAQVTADAGFAAAGPQFLQFSAQQYVGQTLQFQLNIANGPVTTALLIQGGTSTEFPK